MKRLLLATVLLMCLATPAFAEVSPPGPPTTAPTYPPSPPPPTYTVPPCIDCNTADTGFNAGWLFVVAGLFAVAGMGLYVYSRKGNE